MILSLVVICILLQGIGAIQGYVGLVAPDLVPCLECICEAASACNDIFQCAEKTISKEYWNYAGEDIAGGELKRKRDTDENYKDCIKDRICILNTMYHYTSLVLQTTGDVDCDDLITCADYFAAHKFGLLAKKSTSTFSAGLSKRFDRCENHGIVNVTSNWTPRTCEP